jgi:hypothetical protein
METEQDNIGNIIEQVIINVADTKLAVQLIAFNGIPIINYVKGDIVYEQVVCTDMKDAIKKFSNIKHEIKTILK